MDAEMERWWNDRDQQIQALWLASREQGHVTRSLLPTLPSGQRSLAVDRWVYVVGTSVAGQPDARIVFSEEFGAFLDGKLDESRES